ncbi:Protein of unknown function [Pyronema omphalodes CBS 100304]|uniref:Uncharacterized protein n=1 Tax=Pyronema omphalodes (strain CBS 100304) TaxID=1076935 RepID=U4LW66_PYROM|nr:Protein of unknown function [Pyronema omphalodes CBS 100304]
MHKMLCFIIFVTQDLVIYSYVHDASCMLCAYVFPHETSSGGDKLLATSNICCNCLFMLFVLCPLKALCT